MEGIRLIMPEMANVPPNKILCETPISSKISEELYVAIPINVEPKNIAL